MKEEELKSLCRKEGYCTLSSGDISDHYYDLKELYCKEPKLVLDYFDERIKSFHTFLWQTSFDVFASIELGGAIIASGLAVRFNKELSILRKGRESINKPSGKRVIIIDDVTTTGESIEKLKYWCKDAKIVKVIVGIDRSNEE